VTGQPTSKTDFAIRVKRIVEENDINEDQIESIIQDIAAYCLRHSIPFDTVIKSGREALYLEEKYDIPVEKIPELIIQAKERIDRLKDQTQEILRKKQQAQEECDAIRQEHDIIVAELEKYGKEIPLIKRIKELEMELDEEKKLNEHYETRIIGLEKELNNARLEAAKFEGDGIEIYAMWKDTASRLSLCRAERDELKKKNVALRRCLQILFILIILLTMELSLITKYKGSQQYLS